MTINKEIEKYKSKYPSWFEEGISISEEILNKYSKKGKNSWRNNWIHVYMWSERI